MNKQDAKQLAVFNAEVNRGILHTEEWKQKMLKLQYVFDAEEFAKLPLIVQYSPGRQKSWTWWKRLLRSVSAQGEAAA